MHVAIAFSRLQRYSLLLLFVLLSGVDYSDTAHAATLAPRLLFEEPFDQATLPADWQWVREDTSRWSLTTRPGYLRITTQPGTLDENNTIKNLLLRPAPTESYTVSTQVAFTPTQNYHEAALFLYADDNNYIKLSRLYNDLQLGGDTYLFQHEAEGKRVAGYRLAATPAITELAIGVEGRYAIGMVKDQTGQWHTLGRLAISSLESFPYVGIGAYHGIVREEPQPIAVDFGWVRAEATTFNSVYLPSIRTASNPSSRSQVP
jgi:beta-xylosidase